MIRLPKGTKTAIDVPGNALAYPELPDTGWPLRIVSVPPICALADPKINAKLVAAALDMAPGCYVPAVGADPWDVIDQAAAAVSLVVEVVDDRVTLQPLRPAVLTPDTAWQDHQPDAQLVVTDWLARMVHRSATPEIRDAMAAALQHLQDAQNVARIH